MENLSVQLITWNIATQFPEPDLNLQSLLTNTSPDMILFGLQEVKAQPQNLVTDQLLTGEDPWTLCLRKSLSSLGYMKIRTIRLQGIVLSLYSLSRHVPHIRGLETQYTRIGLGGYWGNKGCVSIRWKMYGVSVCVINSHLDAHHHQNQLRIDNYNYILGSHMFSNKETEMILYHDYVFWMGDLNFRLESEEADLTPDDVVNSISNHDFGKLQALDQLAIARKEAKAFSELNENLPNFAPTYKYKIGSSVYDTKRAPAWTDRILFKCNVANYDNYQLSLHQHSYSCLQDMNQSDHKPVCSNFTISVFSDQIASDLLLPCFNPIINFVTTGPHFVNEDLLVIYTVKIDERRFLNSWDWIGLFRADCTNLEDYVAYTYASTKLVRDGAYEVCKERILCNFHFHLKR